MKKFIYVLLAVVFVIGCYAAIYYYWKSLEQITEPVQTAQVETPVESPPVVEEKKPLHALVETVPAELPPLEESDHYVLDALNGLLDSSLLTYLNLERVIHNVVATIDNLPRDKVAVNMLPIQPAKGKFLVEGHDDDLTISPKNAARYERYIKLAEALDTKKLVAMYIKMYPLFQRAYVEIGYPDRYFNDRLLTVIDHLLDAPEIQEPVKLVQPIVFYVFADPKIEQLSIGQRIMVRIGYDNEIKLKTKLKEIQKELVEHIHMGEIPV